MHGLKVLASLLIAIAISGCMVGPKYEPPAIELPDQWQSPFSEGIESGNGENFIWWQSLHDPVLEDLIEKASIQNLDLSIACTRILEARSEWKGKKGDFYPHLDASLTGGHFYNGNKRLIEDVFGCSSSKHCRKQNVNFFEAGFDASWEIDLFGASKHERNALEAKLEGTEESFHDAWITLSAEVARHYIELRNLQQRRILLSDQIESHRESIHLTKELLSIGFSSSIDLFQAEQKLSVLDAQSPLLNLSIQKTIHRLSILLGEMPGCTLPKLDAPGNLPDLPCQKPIGLPSELLRRRPDIRKAERDLAAATELVGAAIASLFPRLSLYGFIGDISTQLKNLSNGSGAVWFAAPQLLLPIFNSRMLRQDVDLNKIRADQALFNYRKTVLNALEEVENSIASYRYEAERNQILKEAFEKAQEAYQMTLNLYERGVKDYLEVLAVKRTFLSAQESYLESNSQLLIHYICLYKALGGSWNNCK